MKKIFNIKNSIFLGIVIISVVLLVFSVSKLKIDSTIYSLLPSDDVLARSVALTSHSSVADKVILYINVDNKSKLDQAIDETDRVLEKYCFLTGTLPTTEEIAEIRSYIQTNSLLLYPYDVLSNPFTDQEISKRLTAKYEYLLSSPFEDISEPFFTDPLNLSLDILKMQFSAGDFLSVYKNGILSEDGKSYIRIFSAGFYPEDYSKCIQLKDLDTEIRKVSKLSSYNSFVFSSHLYFLESSTTIQKEVLFISFISIILTILIFLYFFKSLSLMFYSFLPIVSGIALTFFMIMIFYGKFGAIALAFGATSAGICIDYSIHFISKLELYSTLKTFRNKIGLSIILGWITTVISFAILPFSGIGSLKEIAVFGILVVTFSFLFSWYVLPFFVKPENNNFKIVVIDFLSFSKTKFGTIITFISIFFIVLSILISLFITLEDNPFGLDMNHKQLDESSKLIMDDFGQSTDNVFIAFKGNSKSEVISESIKATIALYTTNPDLLFLNPGLFIPTEEIIKNRFEYIRNNFSLDKFNKTLFDSQFTSDAFMPFVSKYNDILNNKVVINSAPNYFVKELEKSIVEYKGQFYFMVHIGNRLKEKEVSQILNKHTINFITVDILKDSAKGLLVFEQKTIILVFISIFIIFLLLFVIYKNILVAFSMILPPVSGLCMVLAFTVITGNSINIMHLTALILIVGIGVDWAGNSSEVEKNRTIQSILSSGLTTVAGFGVLSFSTSKALFSLGSSMAIGIVTAFLTAYLIIPIIVRRK